MMSLASLMRIVRDAAHGGDDNDNFVAPGVVVGDASGDIFDSVGIAD